MRRIGLIGDVHAEDAALMLAISELQRLGVETLLQVGDIADGPGDLTRTVALLREHRVLAVRGNHDRWLLAGEHRELPYAKLPSDVDPGVLAYLSELPVTRRFVAPSGEVLLCHGLGENDMVGVRPQHEGVEISSNGALQQLIAEQRFRWVLCGHTHRPMLRSFGELSIVNAGTLLRDYERCFTFIDFDTRELVRFRQPAGELRRNLTDWWCERQVLPGAGGPSD